MSDEVDYRMLAETATLLRLLKLYPSGILSYVSDTFDLWKILTTIVPKCREEILARDGKLVIRPDSGDPVNIICGTGREPYQEGELEPFQKGVAELLWDIFGGTVNDAGYKVLDSHIGMIYGDSINYDRADEMTERLMKKGFASTNIVLGVGSFSYQYVTRDTFGFAMKATWAQVDGVGRDLFKDPITDDGVKKSAKGRLAVHRDRNGELVLFNQATPEQEEKSELKTVWEDGEFLTVYSFAEVRENLRNS